MDTMKNALMKLADEAGIREEENKKVKLAFTVLCMRLMGITTEDFFTCLGCIDEGPTRSPKGLLQKFVKLLEMLGIAREDLKFGPRRALQNNDVDWEDWTDHGYCMTLQNLVDALSAYLATLSPAG